MYKITFSIFILFLLMGCGSSSSSSITHITPHAFEAPVLDASTKQAYLTAINTARTSEQNCGSKGIKAAASALVWNDALYKAAYEHSYDLAQSNTASHEGSGTNSDWTAQVQSLGKGSTYKERIDNNGYTNWTAIGENIAFGTNRNTAQKSIDAWLESDGHCANLMNPDYTEVGMAHVEKEGAEYIHYWTQNFGAR